ncbi:regulator of hypoxia-inducible factor 1-like [Anopheles albimanus]|uniref:regulator of hypoxia-inducible factor 1-like n=1 Tax=Anopheles albimanus TaxID=7167 RepID=UPI00163FDBC5|nr:regulator of hypoxia-inducible factor 1-like [Anopheles albimanus]
MAPSSSRRAISVVFCFLVLLGCPLLISGSEEVPLKDDYEMMPPLYLYENVTDCFERHSASLYCVVKTVIKPNPRSALWNTIKSYSKRPSFHEHSLLDRGLCVDACAALVEGLEPALQSFLDTERVTLEHYLLMKLLYDDELPAQQKKYGRLLNICANYHLWMRYNLTGYSELERCITIETRQSTAITGYHVLFALLVFTLTALVICATAMDWRGTRTTANNNNEAAVAAPAAGALWMEFSLRRTWAQLVAPPANQLQRDFAFVEVFRLLSVFSILAIHVMCLFTAAPTANMRLLEELYAHPVVQSLGSVFPFQVHTFFTISGMMLAVYFMQYAVGRRIGWSYLGKAILARYIRVFPLMFLVWLYYVSWFDRLSQGPGDYRFFETERDNCRANGWLNFLFLNNYFEFNNMCMQNSWHLAADFQFFLVGLPFLLLIHRHPRLTKPLLVIAAGFSLAVPTANLYYHKIPGILLTIFKQPRFVFYAHREFEYDYMLFHTNTCSYFAGLFAGLAYHRLKTDASLQLEAIKGIRVLRWAPLPLVVGQASMAFIFFRLDYSQPILWNAIFGAVHRCSWGVMCAVALLHGATVWRARYARIHTHPLVLLLSRLSYGVFMVQFSVLKIHARNATGTGLDYNWRIFLEVVASAWIWCYVSAFVLAVLVEFPIAAICKRLLRSPNGDKPSGERMASTDLKANKGN